MLPMGWNQIRQARVTGINHPPPQQMPYGSMGGPHMMPNQQQFNMYRPPVMQPPHSQMYGAPTMMGNYGMPNPQMMMNNSGKPPEPDGPPPPSPPAPLPSSEPVPPPPPADGQWWIAEMKNLPSDHHRQELERMVNEKWFHTMNTSQQIECWQHKLHLISKQKKGDINQINPSPEVTAPSQTKQVYQSPAQVSNLELDLRKAKEEEANIKQQVITFEKQYSDWKKQFDDWKDKHKSHPNKEQFVQYEQQWMTWQKQMSDQKQDYENSLNSVAERIRHLESQRGMHNQHGAMQTQHNQSPGFPRNLQNPDFSRQQTQPGPRFGLENQYFNEAPPFRGNHQFDGQPRGFPHGNNQGPAGGVGFGPHSSAGDQRPPVQNAQHENNPDSWQSNQYEEQDTENYQENEWGGDFQGYDDQHKGDDYYGDNQDCQGFTETGGQRQGWDDSLSLLPGQGSNAFPTHRAPGPRHRFPQPRPLLGGPGANNRFRGPRPFGQDRPPRPLLQTRPRAPRAAAPLLGVRPRGPRPLLGLNAKLMSLSSDASGNQNNEAKGQSQFGRADPTKSNFGGRGARPRAPTPVRPPLLGSGPRFPNRQDNLSRFDSPKYDSTRREPAKFDSPQQPRGNHDGDSSNGNDAMDIVEDSNSADRQKSRHELAVENREFEPSQSGQVTKNRAVDVGTAAKPSQDFAEDSIPETDGFFVPSENQEKPKKDDKNGGNEAADSDAKEKDAKDETKEEEKGVKPEDDYSHYFTDDFSHLTDDHAADESKKKNNDNQRGRGRGRGTGRGRGSVPDRPPGRGRGSVPDRPPGRGRGSVPDRPPGRGRGSVPERPPGRGSGLPVDRPPERGRPFDRDLDYDSDRMPGRGRGSRPDKGRVRGSGPDRNSDPNLHRPVGRGRGSGPDPNFEPNFDRPPSRERGAGADRNSDPILHRPPGRGRGAGPYHDQNLDPNFDRPHGRGRGSDPHRNFGPSFDRPPGRGRGSGPDRGRAPYHPRSGDYPPAGRPRYFEDDFPFDEADLMDPYRRPPPPRPPLPRERFEPGYFREQAARRGFEEPRPPAGEETAAAKPAMDTNAIMQKAKELSNLDVENLLSAVKSIKSSSAGQDEASKEQPETARKRTTSNTHSVEGEEAAFLSQERAPLARGYDGVTLRRRSDVGLLGDEPAPERPAGVRKENSILGEYTGPARIMNDPLRGRELLDPTVEGLREPLPPRRDPLLDPLLRESYLERELLMQEIQEMREREELRKIEDARRQAELMEALAKPIVQAQKIVETIDYSHGIKKDEGGNDPGRRTPPEFRRGRDPMFRDDDRGRMMDDRFPPHDPRREPPHMMDHRHGMPPRFDDRRPPPRPEPPVHFDPDSPVICADEAVNNYEALKKHMVLLNRERDSVERRRNSVERRRSSLERGRRSREREEERRDRERSLERLRRMERELKDRERMLNERENRLKSPPRRRGRDIRDRNEWKPEGGPPRSRSPIRRRSRERRFRSRSRSMSPRRGRDRSPGWNRRSPVRGRRRFTSPSGESKPRPPAPRPKLEPVCVRIEDLLNDPARQQRPKRIVIILRGLPGSGKSHIAKLIRDHETARGVTPRVLGLDDYFMVEDERFERDVDTNKLVKKKVHEYEYDAAMETSYRNSLFKAFKKTLEDGYFSFVIVDSIHDQVSHFGDLWTAAKKNFFEVYVAEILGDVHVCAKRNIHRRALDELQKMALSWEDTPQHMIRLDVRQMLQDSEIQEVEMGDVSDEDTEQKNVKDKMTLEQLAGIPQSKWELMEANERLDKLDGIKKKKLTSSQPNMAEFLSVTDDYVQRSSAPGKKRVRWADIEEKSEQQRLREVGFVVGNTDWSRMVDGDSHADAALNRTKFI